MIEETDSAIVSYVTGLTLLDSNKATIQVPVGFGVPEDWVKQKKYPSINVYRLPDGIHLAKEYITNPAPAKVNNGDHTYSVMEYKTPFWVTYSIEFLVKWEEDYVNLLENLLIKFKPYGFKRYIIVNGDIVTGKQIGRAHV